MTTMSKQLYYALRWRVLERDNFTCRYCGRSAPEVALEVDHVISLSEDGQTSEENLVTSCYSCNRGRGVVLRARREGRIYTPTQKRVGKTEQVIKYLEEHGTGDATTMAGVLKLNRSTISRVLTTDDRIKWYGSDKHRVLYHLG